MVRISIGPIPTELPSPTKWPQLTQLLTDLQFAVRRPSAQLNGPNVAQRFLAHLRSRTEPPQPTPARSSDQFDFA